MRVAVFSAKPYDVESLSRAGAPTLDQVAELAGVSRSTASRAINGGLRVSPEAQTAVDRAIALIDRAEYKRRQAPPGVKLRPKAFGRDRRTPITNRWRG